MVQAADEGERETLRRKRQKVLLESPPPEPAPQSRPGCLTLPIGEHRMGPMAKKKNMAAVALSKLAAKGRKRIPPEQRTAIARLAARARWAKRKGD
jgi:hypothetical protein